MNVYQIFNIYLRQKKPTREGPKNRPALSYPIVFIIFLIDSDQLSPAMLSTPISGTSQIMGYFFTNFSGFELTIGAGWDSLYYSSHGPE
jgi:hypothetical protein